jgi:hypothetical protein
VLEYIKNLILERYINFRLKLFKDKEDSLNFPQEIRNVKNILLIIPENNEYNTSIQSFISELYKLFDKAEISTFERSSFRKSDGNWFGLPRESYLKNFQDVKFDLLIDLNLPHDNLCTYICALIAPPLRMSWTSGKFDHIYNLQIRSKYQGLIEDKLANILNYFESFRKTA